MPHVLFAIRCRLGDTLASYASVRSFARHHSHWETTLLVRREYAFLFREEPGIRVIPCAGRIQGFSRLLWERATRPPYDVLAVGCGFGKAARWLPAFTRARRCIHYLGLYRDVFPEFPAKAPRDLFEYAWGAAVLVAGHFPKPTTVRVPSLCLRYAKASRNREIVGVVPLANAMRRNLDRSSLRQVIDGLRARHPHATLRVFFNDGDSSADIVRSLPTIAAVEPRPFRSIEQLAREYLELTSWVGTDTGPFHLALAMGIPSTVFLGPTTRSLIIRPDEHHTASVQLPALADSGCGVETCVRPACLYRAVAAWSASPVKPSLESTPAACPLRSQVLDEASIVNTA